jgi:hypothetical protein
MGLQPKNSVRGQTFGRLYRTVAGSIVHQDQFWRLLQETAEFAHTFQTPFQTGRFVVERNQD